MSTIPQTLREKLVAERARLYTALENAQTAYSNLVDGRVTSYSLGNRTVSRNTPDLNSLLEFIKKTENRIDEIEAQLSGRSIRRVTRNVFIDPSGGLGGFIP